MSLALSSLSLDSFRGYAHICLEDLSRFNIFVGPNACGKTNIIEAIQLISNASSFRKPLSEELVSWGCENASIAASYVAKDRDVHHCLFIKEGERTYEVNGKKVAASALKGSIPCVLFIPDDLQLVKASSSYRRGMIDELGAQLSSTHEALKSEYATVLRQRNHLLKEGVFQNDLMESWDDILAQTGARLCVSRWKLFLHLKNSFQTISSSLDGNKEISALYVPSWVFMERGTKKVLEEEQVEDIGVPDVKEVCSHIKKALREHREDEIRRKMTLVGPHKDEVFFFIENKNARFFASQGQQRSIALAEKLAEVEVIKKIKGEDPLLLLDDVMSELDESHRTSLVSFLDGVSQIFLTTTDIGYFNKSLLKNANIIDLPILGTRIQY